MSVLTDDLQRLQDVSTERLLDVLCARLAFTVGPDVSAFTRAAATRLPELRALLGASDDEWTEDALRRRCEER